MIRVDFATTPEKARDIASYIHADMMVHYDADARLYYVIITSVYDMQVITRTLVYFGLLER